MDLNWAQTPPSSVLDPAGTLRWGWEGAPEISPAHLRRLNLAGPAPGDSVRESTDERTIVGFCGFCRCGDLAPPRPHTQ